MKRHLASFLLAMLIATPPVGATTKGDDASVLAALGKACDAFRDGDVAFLSTFLARDFTLTSSSGQVTTYEENLAEVRAREPRYEEFRNHDMKVRLYGNTALVNGITSLKGTAAGKAFALDVQFTDTLVRSDGRWTLVASHASPLVKPRTP